jgi:hypothetical protein
MKNFLLLILLVILAYSLLKAMTRILKIFKPGNDNSDNTGFNNTSGKKGTTITFTDDSLKKKRIDKDKGEYIDYDEVK